MTDIKTPHAKISIHGLGNRIKRKIFSIWFVKYELPLLAGEVIVLFTAIAFIARFVFVERVISNTFVAGFGNPFKILMYLFGAFVATNFLIKAFILLFLGGILLFLRDINKSIVTYILMHRKRM